MLVHLSQREKRGYDRCIRNARKYRGYAEAEIAKGHPLDARWLIREARSELAQARHIRKNH